MAVIQKHDNKVDTFITRIYERVDVKMWSISEVNGHGNKCLMYRFSAIDHQHVPKTYIQKIEYRT